MIVRTIARSKPRDIFGELKTESFYVAEALEIQAEKAKAAIEEYKRKLEEARGEVMVKLKIAEALQGKNISLLPVSEGGMNLKTTDVNRLIETMGIKAMSESGTETKKKQ